MMSGWRGYWRRNRGHGLDTCSVGFAWESGRVLWDAILWSLGSHKLGGAFGEKYDAVGEMSVL